MVRRHTVKNLRATVQSDTRLHNDVASGHETSIIFPVPKDAERHWDVNLILSAIIFADQSQINRFVQSGTKQKPPSIYGIVRASVSQINRFVNEEQSKNHPQSMALSVLLSGPKPG